MLQIFFLICFTTLQPKYLVDSACLKEEFTWTRISYVATQSSSNLYGSSKPSGGYSSYHNHYRMPVKDDTLLFPDSYQQIGLETYTNQNEDYIYENNIPMGVNIWKKKLFITVPRRRLGVPSTLNYIPIDSPTKHNVPLIPYPDLRTNLMIAPPGQEHLVSVYRVSVDPCDRLWMVDTGVIELPGNRTVIGPQRIVIIDLNTDKIIKTYNFKESDLHCGTTLALVTVDVTANTCNDAYAYFPDLAGYGLIVYSLKKDDSWRIRHNYFFLEPLAGEFNIGGARFQWNDGIFSGGLTGLQNDGYRTYIFHAMSGTHLYAVSTKILRSKELATRSYHENDFKVLGDRGPNSQTSASDLHQRSAILFLSLVNQNAVGCWNIRKPFEQSHFGIVHKNDSAMIYPSDLKISGDNVVVLTNTMPVFLYSKLNYDQINFRVWIENVYSAVKGTICEDSRYGGYY